MKRPVVCQVGYVMGAANSFSRNEQARIEPSHTWQPQDLIELAEQPPTPPDIGDLFYAGRKHVVSGEFDAGKSWLLLAVGARELGPPRRKLASMTVPVVKKEFLEELGEEDANAYYIIQYSAWAYSFGLDGRNYGATVPTDMPKDAYITEEDGTRHPEYEDDLRIIGAYLRDEAGVRRLRMLDGRKLRTKRLSRLTLDL